MASATVDEQSFGSRLRALREAAGLSQEELAGRAGLSSHAVSALERGTRTRPYPHTVRALAAAVGATDEDRAALVNAVPPRARGAAGPPAPARHLVVPSTPLLGREHDVATVRELLAGHRLVTLTGPGGVGKTRLAAAVASDVRDRFAHGVAYVELAPVLDPAAVLPAVAAAVDAPAGDGEPAAALAGWLADRQQLLVLDNLEHVIEVAPLVAGLVEAAPGLTVLATSRAPLRVRGEREQPVAPLAVDPEGEAVPPAVRLLLDRAGAVSPGWGSRPADLTAVMAVCRRLAGLPLAIELAAARARILDPAGLFTRLDQALLSGGRDLPERHRTMRATLDWSHALLTGEQQVLLRRLAVFVGGFRLDDLEEVAALLDGAEGDVLGTLESLAEQSLVTTDTSGAVTRHRLLEPVAQYAAARLAEAGEEGRVRAAHAAHFVRLAEEHEPRYRDAGQVAALTRVDAEHPNLTAALEHALAVGDHVTAARGCWGLWMYWWLRGLHVHGRRLAEAALSPDLPPGVRVRADLAAATMAFAMDDVAAAREHWDRAEAHADDDPVATANAVAGRGLADLATGDLEGARTRFERARGAAVGAGPDVEWTVALSWIWSGTVSLLLGDPERAVAEIERGLASARSRGDLLSTYIALYNLSQVELSSGRPERARVHLDEGTRLSRETGDHANLAYLLEAAAVVEARLGTHARVPLMLGAARAIREELGSFGYGYYRPDPTATAEAEAEARRHLGDDRFDDAVDVGRGMDPDRAAALSLREPAG